MTTPKRLWGRLFLLGIFLGLLSGPDLQAAVYKFTTDDGKTEYVDSKSKIPEKYRDKAIEIKPVESHEPIVPSGSGSAPAGSPPVPAKGDKQGKPGIDVDFEGNTRDYWIGRLKRLEDRLAEIERRIKEIEQVGYINPDSPGGMKLAYDLNQERTALEQEKAEIPKKLDEIREEARRKGAPPGWFR